MGQDYNWTLEERTLDGKKGICIIDGSGVASWYTNPDVWNYVLMKPFWGACTWSFIDSGVEVPTSIHDVEQSATTSEHIYNLHGQKLQTLPEKGVVVIDGKKVVVK